MGFDNMTVVFQTSLLRDVTTTIPVKETTLQRFTRLFTGKAAPTQEIEVIREVDGFRELSFDGTQDAETARDLMERMTNIGWEVVSVVVDSGYTSTELVVNGSPDGSEVGQLLVAFDEDPFLTDGFVAAVHEYGFGFADDLNEWMQDNYRGEYDSPAAFAEDWFNETESYDVSGVPSWVSVDWDDSADNLKYDLDYVEHPETYSTHVFWRHG